MKRESELQYQGDLAAGRTLGGARKGPSLSLPAWGGLGIKSAQSSEAAGWMPKWLKKEPELAPEPEIVVRHQLINWSAWGWGVC